MRRPILILIAATTIAAPAAAQTDNAASDNIAVMADPETNIATNATDAATLNGMTGDPALQSAPPVTTTSEAPGVTDATVTPDTGEDGGGFPWGLLGILGLLGLIGRFRS